jgi:hypothetical protein
MTTPASLLLIARRVYPENRIFLQGMNDELVFIDGEDAGESIQFNPRLNGTDREKAQALDCIVMVYRERGISWLKDERGFPILEYQMLDAALLALEGE